MALFTSELSQLKVGPLEVIANVPEPERDLTLETLTAPQGEVGLVAILTLKGMFPRNGCSSYCTPADACPTPPKDCDGSPDCTCTCSFFCS